MTGTTQRKDLYYLFRGQMEKMVPIGPVAEGLRMNGHFSGTVVEGEGKGGHIELVDYFRIRPDGVGVVDAREVLTLDGQTVSVDVHGYVLPPAGLPVPTIEEMLSPDFVWADAPSTIECFATFRTAAPALAHLNRVTVAHTGYVNFATGELVVEAHRIADLARRTRDVAA